jgi:hypothetical protein
MTHGGSFYAGSGVLPGSAPFGCARRFTAGEACHA